MKIGLLILAFLFVGCEENSTTITNVNQGDGGTYISNNDGTVTYTYTQSEGDASDGTTGEFDAGDDEQECKSKGYFYCPITNTCNNTALNGGSCRS